MDEKSIVSLIYKIVERLECRTNTLGMFLNLSKALDCLDHKILLDTSESHGIASELDLIPSKELNLFKLPINLLKKSTCAVASLWDQFLAELYLWYMPTLLDNTAWRKIVSVLQLKSASLLVWNAFLKFNECIQAFVRINLKINSPKSYLINFF